MKSYTTLRLEKGAHLLGSPDLDDYPVIKVRWEGRWIDGHRALIYANDADHFGIVGPGKISGNPALSGREMPRRPVIIEPINCTDVRLEGFSTEHQSMWSIHPTYCENVVAKNLTIRSTGGNGDGVDVDSCKHVRHRRLRHRNRRRLHRHKIRPGHGRLPRCQTHRRRSDFPLHAGATAFLRVSASAAKRPAASATCGSSTANSPVPEPTPFISRAAPDAARLSRTFPRTIWTWPRCPAVSCGSISRQRYPGRRTGDR